MYINMNKIISPRIASGTMELLPKEQILFQRMLAVITAWYERFGFVPLETPVFELKDVLLTKSGGETEKQVYFVQSTGSLQQGHEPELALRFDLTVPLARYVAQHERELYFPFRRYQIQRVYRGERAQKGRFREFYQCDVDIIGKDSLSHFYDAEIPAIIAGIFEELNVGDFTIHFSNRKILKGLLNSMGAADSEVQTLVLREVDKIDKIGKEKVSEAIINLGITSDNANVILGVITFQGTNSETLQYLSSLGIKDELFLQGVEEVSSLINSLNSMSVPENRTKFNLSIARGLDYYTGTVYETLINNHPEFGSVCSGGRYDDLASHYTKSNLPGVGISIGLTRLFDQLLSSDLLKDVAVSDAMTEVLIANVSSELRADYLELAVVLRKAGFKVSVYMDDAKLDKQLRYADKAFIPVVLFLGEEEKKNNSVIVKNMKSKEQKIVELSGIADAVRLSLGV